MAIDEGSSLSTNCISTHAPQYSQTHLTFEKRHPHNSSYKAKAPTAAANPITPKSNLTPPTAAFPVALPVAALTVEVPLLTAEVAVPIDIVIDPDIDTIDVLIIPAMPVAEGKAVVLVPEPVIPARAFSLQISVLAWVIAVFFRVSE